MFVLSRHSFITDALTGEHLNIEDQCVPVKLVNDENEITDDDGHARLMSMAEPLLNRSRGYRDVPRILITASAASGKTVTMRQVIHGCCKWNHRDANDVVPMLVLVIDLQRSMQKNPDAYANEPDLIAVYWRLVLSESDPLRFRMLMQVRSSAQHCVNC